jgi:hypothetical protein
MNDKDIPAGQQSGPLLGLGSSDGLGPASEASNSWEPKNLMRKAKKVRRTSKAVVTCPASRHVQLMAEGLMRSKGYPMLADEPEHCASSMLATVVNLYEARVEIGRLKETYGAVQAENADLCAQAGHMLREIGRLRFALREVLEFQSAPNVPTIHDWGRWRRAADGTGG